MGSSGKPVSYRDFGTEETVIESARVFSGVSIVQPSATVVLAVAIVPMLGSRINCST